MSVVSDVVASRELLWNLTLRELRTKYRRSFLGWTWSMLNPLANVAIYWFVFGVLFNAKAPEGDPSGLTGFAFYLLVGLLPWNFFSLVNTLGMEAMSSNAGLVRRVSFPREVLVFSNVGHAVVQFLIELGLLIVVLLFAGSALLPYIPVALGLTVLLAIFASGFALALSTLSVYFKDLGYLWSIVMQVWFFLTPIIYGPEIVQDRVPEWGQWLLRLNPMAHFVSAYRDCFYDNHLPGLGKILVIIGGTALSLILGWTVFAKMGKRLPEEV